MARRRTVSWVFFTDLLFNLVVGLVVLFFLALLLINPITDRKKIDSKAEFIITLDWPENSNADVDLWLLDPTGARTGYLSKENNVVTLERDDIGLQTDTHRDQFGNYVYNSDNSEIITVRAPVAGEWIVNVHYYASRPIPRDHPSGLEDVPFTDPGRIPVEVEVKVIKLNPIYEIVTSKKILLTFGKEERTMARFVTDKYGNVIKIINIPQRFVVDAMGTPFGNLNNE